MIKKISSLLVIVVSYPCFSFYQQESNFINWKTAVSILQNGEVTKVFQSHNRKVELHLKNGSRVVTQSPLIDDVLREIKKCGETCKSIKVAVE